jgi:cytochrome c
MAFRRRTGLLLAAGVALVGLLSLVHPFGDLHGATVSAGGLLTDTQLPEDIRRTLTAKCADCHSSQTRWPAYSYVAPVSWLVEQDVSEGRKHLNFSAWQTYTQAQQLDLLNRLAAEIKSGQMPPPRYTFIHRSARLPADEQQAMYAWAKAERRRLREATKK